MLRFPQSRFHRLSNSESRAPRGPGKKEHWIERGGRAGGRHESTFGPEGLTRYSVKEVIQPQVPLRLPCYDFAPVTRLAFGGLVSLARVPAPTSGTPSFHGVTGGVYKARERIHRGIADPRLLAIPASCRRVAADNLN